jgi:hypothetical protein
MDLSELNEMDPWDWPEDADQTILAVLHNKKAPEAERLLACELGGDFLVASDEMAAAMLALLEDAGEPAALRGQAAISLGPALESMEIDEYDFPDDGPPLSDAMFRRIQDTFRKLYQTADVPKLTRRRILEASVRAEADWHANAIRAAYVSGDDEWKLTAVFGMQHVDGFDAQILEALQSADKEILFEAVLAAGSQGLAEAAPIICKLAKSNRTERSLRLAAIEALGGIPCDDGEEILLDLSTSTDEEIAETADEALAISGALVELDGDYDPEDVED